MIQILKGLLFIIFIFLFECVVGQPKPFVLQIDTLLINGYNDFHISVDNERLIHPFKHSDSFVTISNSHPNLVCKLILASNSSYVRISLDKKGGYLELLNAYDFKSDTIKIGFHQIIKTIFPDTHRTRIGYFRMYGDSLGERIKEQRFDRIDQIKDCDTAQLSLIYNINDCLYHCKTQWVNSPHKRITVFHNYRPKKCSIIKYRIKKRKIYSHGKTISSRTYNVIILNLSAL